MKTMMGWWFAPEDLKLPNGDGRQVKVGVTHEVKGKPVLCKNGLHASPSVRDALGYASSSKLFRVRLSGKIAVGDDKACATKRTYIASFDAESVLRQFARECALSVIHLWDAPQVVKDYLKTGDEKLRAAARDATGAAARAAAWDAAGAATRAAAWDAAGAAAWDAAGDATRDAAGDATRAAWDATRDKQKNLLDRLVNAALKKHGGLE